MRFRITNFKYNFVKSLGNISIFPAFLPHSIIKFVNSKILRTLKLLKLKFFKAEAFGNTPYAESDNEEKINFYGFKAY